MTRQSLDLNIKSVKTILKVLPTYDFFFIFSKIAKYNYQIVIFLLALEIKIILNVKLFE
jgi:hypothetical protein